MIYDSSAFVLPLPPGHGFPVAKYARLAERVAGLAAPLVRVPDAATGRELGRAHDPAYVEAVSRGTLDERAQRRIGFPWSTAMVERSRRSAGATLAACRSAVDRGLGINLAGGTHHAHRAHGEGYCVFNDAAVAARAMQAEGLATRVLVVDLDVHQGDGTASIFAGDPDVTTLSIHGRRNFPFRRRASTIDVELDDGTGDDAYLATLATVLPRAIDRARPDLAIYLAGADPFRGDRLGRLALGKAGLADRDRMVLDRLAALGIPVAIAMAGGYADDVDDIVDIHLATVAIALERAGALPRARDDACVLDCPDLPREPRAAPPSPMNDPVLLSRSGPVATLTLNRPDALNVLDDAMVDALIPATASVAADASIRVLVVRGAGRHFMAGGDIRIFARESSRPADERQRTFQRLVERVHVAVETIARMPQPVVARVHGAVAGFGMSLMNACDLAIASDDAYFAAGYRQIGITPDGGGTWSLPRIVGQRRALGILLLGERFGAADALAMGLVNRVAPLAELDAAVDAAVRSLADGPREALAATKRLVRDAQRHALSEHLQAEAVSFGRMAAADDFVEGVTSFLEKRPARFAR